MKMTTHYMRFGNQYRLTDKSNLDIQSSLEIGTYTVSFDKERGEFFLIKIDDFKVPGKLYGDTSKQADRIINTFKDRPSGTGVLLVGEKGSGKSLLAKQISIVAASKGVPTIVLNSPFCGDSFNKFIQSIDQEAVIVFDEFEKTYREIEHQEQLLTLLDGTYPSKKLFVLTSNDKFRIDQHMRNRPGRIYYMYEFGGLDGAFIEEYCNDNLIDKSQIDSLKTFASSFGKFNFDSLKAMVEEMNRYGESASDVSRVLNVKPTFEENQNYTIVSMQIKGVEIPKKDIDRNTVSVNPMTGTFRIEHYVHGKKKISDTVQPDFELQALNDEEDGYWNTCIVNPSNIVSMFKDGRVIYSGKSEDGREYTLEIMRQQHAVYDYHKLF